MTLCSQGREGARGIVIDFLENRLCVWCRSVRSAGREAFVSKWHLEGLNYFSGVEAFIEAASGEVPRLLPVALPAHPVLKLPCSPLRGSWGGQGAGLGAWPKRRHTDTITCGQGFASAPSPQACR